MMMNEIAACFHCGQPVAASADWHVNIEGVERGMPRERCALDPRREGVNPRKRRDVGKLLRRLTGGDDVLELAEGRRSFRRRLALDQGGHERGARL